jgi:hypothetical protein
LRERQFTMLRSETHSWPGSGRQMRAQQRWAKGRSGLMLVLTFLAWVVKGACWAVRTEPSVNQSAPSPAALQSH